MALHKLLTTRIGTLPLLLSLTLITACNHNSNSNSNSSAVVGPMNTPTMVADQAMNSKGVVMALPSAGGFFGNLYIEPRSQMIAPDTQMVGCYQYGDGAAGIAAYLTQPSWITQQVLFQTLDVPNQNFLQGFPAGSGSGLISVDSYFAMDVTGLFHLAPGDVAGYYQFAVIADDAAQVLLNPEGDGLDTQMLVDDQKPASFNNGTCLPQTQAAHMSCTSNWSDQTSDAVQTIYLTSTDVVPLEVKYWQGPGQALALVVMYRFVADPTNTQSLVDADCGQTLPFSQGSASLNDLLTRWNVVSFSNLIVQ